MKRKDMNLNFKSRLLKSWVASLHLFLEHFVGQRFENRSSFFFCDFSYEESEKFWDKSLCNRSYVVLHKYLQNFHYKTDRKNYFVTKMSKFWWFENLDFFLENICRVFILNNKSLKEIHVEMIFVVFFFE